MIKKKLASNQNFIELEKEVLDFWYKEKIVDQYLQKNKNSKTTFSFIDGPITANNKMGVHHGWGRTYKDIFQRYHTLLGDAQRYQNGFDCQGLWVEVEVEKELGFKTKKDIESYGIDLFVEKCKERVVKYAHTITEQSKRLGYLMDWENSYFTMSEENNYAIWNFLKQCHEKGWIYKGRDAVPWCPRCGTAISQHEILSEEYQNITHKSIYFALPIINDDRKLLVWTTTPWTIPGNVAVAVNPELDYVQIKSGHDQFILAKKMANKIIPNATIIKELKGKEILDLEYSGPFDDLSLLTNINHRVVSAPELVTESEGTGLVHIAPGAGMEDFALSKEYDLAVINLIGEDAVYNQDLDYLSGKNAKDNPEMIIELLKERGFLFKTLDYTHRYPNCWRCKTELVFRVVDEWYISMDTPDQTGKTFREQIIQSANMANWMPQWGLYRELDWLKNMHDWLISKKRYWGLALPIYECQSCSSFQVIGSKGELKEKAVIGWQDFEGNTPHRPYIDHVEINCDKCNQPTKRILDVGNPWLDAGIVPEATLKYGVDQAYFDKWFPADFVVEGFPGQFKNWFYSLLAMSTVLTGQSPFKNLLGHGNVLDENGKEMHKSTGNAIWFDDAAEEMGSDIMRIMYALANPELNLKFGYKTASDIKRRFYLIFWNSFLFYYNNENKHSFTTESKHVLDLWILDALGELIADCQKSLENFDASSAMRAIERFIVNDLSGWYIRLSRKRAEDPQTSDQVLVTLRKVFTDLSIILSPFAPFISEKIYTLTTGNKSVLLENWPKISPADKSLTTITENIRLTRELAELGHSTRKSLGIKVRQTIDANYTSPERLDNIYEEMLCIELNIRNLTHAKGENKKITINDNYKTDKELINLGITRDLIREIQTLRKNQRLNKSQKIKIYLPSWPEEMTEAILNATSATEIIKDPELKIELV